MKNNLENKLKELKIQQEKGNLQRCPRCGSLSMRPNPIENALSRYCDIYICSPCGTEEGLDDAFGHTMKLDNWYFANN